MILCPTSAVAIKLIWWRHVQQFTCNQVNAENIVIVPNLNNCDSADSQDEDVSEVWVNSESPGDHVEGRVGEDSGGRNPQEDVAQERLVLAVEFHLLNSEK